MTFTLALAVAITGGLGASARYAVDYVIQDRVNSRGPLGILVVNLSASLLAGFVVGLATAASEPLFNETLRFAIIAGFLGGYSTLSTVSVDTLTLARNRQIGWMLVNSVGMLALSIGAVILGLFVTGALR